MASKSLNLLLNSALAAMAIGVVAFNTGMLDGILPARGVDTTAASGETAETGQNENVAAENTDTGADNAAEAEEIASADNGSNEAGVAEDGATNLDTKADAEVVPPRFDIVRVEPDGNVVIAGNATSESTVEVITGTRVLGETKSGVEGDFAVVLTEPLDPGDYTIVLRATSLDNSVAMSTETAIVSVPETEAGEVLAIVDEPGKPSKLITVPEAEEAKETAGDEDGTQVAAAEPQANEDAAAAEAETKTDMTEDATDVADTDGMEDAGQAEDASQSETDVAAADTSVSDDEAADEGSSAAEKEEPMPSAAEPAADLSIAVEAVEIEGDHVFVAGTANPGKVVRVYANKDLIGETKSSEIGRFLVESSRGLAIGEYIIRADMLEVGSADVIARAAVPFEREAGETIAAVAPQPEGEEQAAADDSMKSADAAEMADEGTVVETEVASAEPAAEATDEQIVSESRESTASGAEDNSAATSVNDGEIAVDESLQADDKGTVTDSGTADNTASGDDADTAAGDETKTEMAAAEPGDIELPEFDENIALTAPKLEKTSGSVIIRRGDTLWHISRRVYGRGIRYTTIYTANRDQIKNPDRIWPGQIFDVPGVSDEGEAGDLDAIADRAPDAVNN